ncbi:MAG: adenosylcobalamin-dependent ribonucleoside-diphosphate reductase [Nanoarchaeota archaeon]|nr:adenosylcobalamin-dependent ribonucleoside-diphosphate reductase [Nanoarchaeota archaeon]
MEQIINSQQQNQEGVRNEFFRKINEMFDHKSKLSTLVGDEKIKAYKETYFYLFDLIEKKELPVLDDFFSDNTLAQHIYKNKYYLKDLNGNHIEARPEDVYLRLAAFIACIEENTHKREEAAKKFYMDLFEGYYLPGGRVITGSGDLFRLKTLANCFVSLIEEDSLEGIYKSSYEAARTYSYGGGIGIDISQLRPKNSRVHNAADSSTGAVSFMELYSLTTGLIGQAGRRGALMLTIDCKHPDVMDFINIKQNPNWTTDTIMQRLQSSGMFDEDQLAVAQKNIVENTQVRFANISIKVSDEFMQAVDEQNQFGKEKIVVYKKPKTGKTPALKSDDYNYAYGMSKKDVSTYELVGGFDSFEALNQEMSKLGFSSMMSKDVLDNIELRDYYGEFVVEDKNADFDLAIKYSGDYLLYYSGKNCGDIKELVKARDVWNKFVEGNYQTAEPGLILWSQMTKYSPSNYVGRPISCTNPCGEVPLESGGACNLGSINLSRMVDNGFTSSASINWERLKTTTHNLTRFLDNVVWWNENLNALESQRDAASITRRLGLGVMGIADLFNQLGIGYDSEEGLKLLESIMDTIAQEAYRESAKLAAEKGPAPAFSQEYFENPFYVEILEDDVKELIRKNGIRNIAILAIAPTGTISNAITGFRTPTKNYVGVSGGIEPIFALFYQRRSEQMNQGGLYNVFHSTIQAYLDVTNQSHLLTAAPEEVNKALPAYMQRTAHKISPKMRVKIQGIAQQYVDHSISSTINLSEDIEPETISNIYLDAWKHGLKGITIYRDGSRFPILSVQGEETDFQRFKDKKFKVGDKVVRGNDVIVGASGKLTTVYHQKHQNTGVYN